VNEFLGEVMRFKSRAISASFLYMPHLLKT